MNKRKVFIKKLLNIACRFCPLFPFQSIKTVRLRLNLTRQFIEDPRYVFSDWISVNRVRYILCCCRTFCHFIEDQRFILYFLEWLNNDNQFTLILFSVSTSEFCFSSEIRGGRYRVENIGDWNLMRCTRTLSRCKICCVTTCFQNF